MRLAASSQSDGQRVRAQGGACPVGTARNIGDKQVMAVGRHLRRRKRHGLMAQYVAVRAPTGLCRRLNGPGHARAGPASEDGKTVAAGGCAQQRRQGRFLGEMQGLTAAEGPAPWLDGASEQDDRPKQRFHGLHSIFCGAANPGDPCVRAGRGAPLFLWQSAKTEAPACRRVPSGWESLVSTIETRSLTRNRHPRRLDPVASVRPETDCSSSSGRDRAYLEAGSVGKGLCRR